MKDVTKILKPKQDKNKQNKMTEGKNLLRHSLQKNKKPLLLSSKKKIQSTTTEAIGPQKKKYTEHNNNKKGNNPFNEIEILSKNEQQQQFEAKTLEFLKTSERQTLLA